MNRNVQIFFTAIGIGVVVGTIVLIICARLLPVIGVPFYNWQISGSILIIGFSMMARNIL